MISMLRTSDLPHALAAYKAAKEAGLYVFFGQTGGMTAHRETPVVNNVFVYSSKKGEIEKWLHEFTRPPTPVS